jgi:hypothetical protein
MSEFFDQNLLIETAIREVELSYSLWLKNGMNHYKKRAENVPPFFYNMKKNSYRLMMTSADAPNVPQESLKIIWGPVHQNVLLSIRLSVNLPSSRPRPEANS